MIKLENIVKYYPIKGGKRKILDDINLEIYPGEKIGILGKNGAGKSTLVRILGGVEEPTSGKITKDMRISWPLAFTGSFQGSLTGADNVRFVCRVYNADYKKAMEMVDSFAELGKYLYEPVKVYSSGMRARLAFAISLAIDFDCYLIDEVISVGDAKFHEKCRVELFEKRADKAMIIVSHELHNIREHCNKVAILDKGKLTIFDNIDESVELYNSL
nr:ABC transporter ATP-binding protein [uncultured Moraxella sp.]